MIIIGFMLIVNIILTVLSIITLVNICKNRAVYSDSPISYRKNSILAYAIISVLLVIFGGIGILSLNSLDALNDFTPSAGYEVLSYINSFFIQIIKLFGFFKILTLISVGECIALNSIMTVHNYKCIKRGYKFSKTAKAITIFGLAASIIISYISMTMFIEMLA